MMSLRTRRRRPGGQLGSAHRLVPAPRLALAVALLRTATLGPAVPCRAALGLVIEAPNVIAVPGSSGSFDVLLFNTNPAGASATTWPPTRSGGPWRVR